MRREKEEKERGERGELGMEGVREEDQTNKHVISYEAKQQ